MKNQTSIAPIAYSGCCGQFAKEAWAAVHVREGKVCIAQALGLCSLYSANAGGLRACARLIVGLQIAHNSIIQATKPIVNG